MAGHRNVSRGVLAALLLAVYVSAASEEFVDVESVVEAKQALLQVAEASETKPAPVPPTLAQLKKQNEQELTKVAAIKKAEAEAKGKAEAEVVVGQQVKAKQLKADTASAAVDNQRTYLKTLKVKMDHASKSAKLMEEILASTKQHKDKMKELNVKLAGAAGAQAVRGAKAAVEAQKAEEAKQKAALDKLAAKLKELKECSACPGHADKIQDTNKKMVAQQEALRKAKLNLKLIIAASKSSIVRSSAEVVKGLTAQINDAKRKLQDLEKKAIQQLQSEGAASQIDTNNLASSKNDAIASAAAKQELVAASKKRVDKKSFLQKAKDKLASVIKSYTEEREKNDAKKAVEKAKIKGEQGIGKAKAKLDGEEKELASKKKMTGTKTTDMKGMAIQAAATNNLATLAAAVGETVVAVESYKTAQQRTKSEKAKVSAEEEQSITAQLAAKAKADEKVAKLSSAASKLASSRTSPELESMELIADAKIKTRTADAEKLRKDAITALGASVKLVSLSVNTTSQIEVKRRKAKADAKLLEFNTAQKSKNSAAKAAKLIALEADLKGANAAMKAAQAKAADTYKNAMKKLAEACQPKADVVAPAEGILTMMGDAVANLATVAAEKVSLKLSSVDLSTMSSESRSLALEKQRTMLIIRRLATAKKDIQDAKQTKALVKFATAIRPAEASVTSAKAQVKEASGELSAAKKVKAQVDQRAAKDAAEKWQKREKIKIGGPNVEALEKKSIKIKQEIASAQQAREKTKVVTKTMTVATLRLQQQKAKKAAAVSRLEKAEASLKQVPKGKNGVVGPARSDALEKIARNTEQVEKANASVKRAQVAVEKADTFTPQLKAVAKTLAGAVVKMKVVRDQQIGIQNKIEDTSLSLKAKGLTDSKKRDLDKRIVQLTQDLIANKAKMADQRQVLQDSSAKKGELQREQRRAAEKVTKAKSANVDAGNSFVRDTLKYALKEKAEKTVGVEAYQKKLDKIKTANKEKANKNEAAIKKEKLAEADKVEKAKKVMAKKVRALEQELKEKKVANEAKDKKKKRQLQRDAIKRKLALQLKEEKGAKAKKKSDAEKATKDAVIAEQKLLAKMRAQKHARKVSEEHKAKAVQTATISLRTEGSMRASSEQEEKQAIEKVDSDIKKQKGTSTYDAAVAARVSKVQKLKAAELKVKNTYAAASKTAQKEETKANTEVAKGTEIASKTAKKENVAKLEVENALAERATKTSNAKLAAEKAAEAKVAAKMKEEKNKVKLKKLSVVEDQRKRDLASAKKDLAKLDTQWKTLTDQYKKNKAGYALYAAAKAAQRQEVATRQLVEAEKDLKEDQAMLAEAVEPVVRAKVQLQIDRGERLVAAKKALVSKDGQAASKERRWKTNNNEDSLLTKNKLYSAEKANDNDASIYEKATKKEKAAKEQYSEITNKKERNSKLYTTLKMNLATADVEKQKTTTEIGYKTAQATRKAAEAKLKDWKAQDKSREKDNKESKTAEAAAKKGIVIINFTKEKEVTSKAALKNAVKEESSEVDKKFTQRKTAATQAHLSATAQAENMAALCKSNNNAAMNAVGKATAGADAKAKQTGELNQKAECKRVNKALAQVNMAMGKERKRKTADKNQYKLMKELERKYYKQKLKFDVALNKVKDIDVVKKNARTTAEVARANLEQAREKLEKRAKQLPGGKLIKSKRKKKTEEKSKPESVPTAKATTTPDPQVAAAANFTSPYVQLAADLKKKPYMSVAARRRAVQLKKTEKAAEEAKKLASAVRVSTKAKKAGFSAHYWSGVTGVTNMAQAIKKISKRKPTKTETVSSINFAETKKFWTGLDNHYSSNFVARFRGHLQVPAKATYTFTAKCDDGCIVYINGKAVVENDGMKDESSKKTGKVSLSAGSVAIVVDYFAGVGKAGLVVEWEGGGLQKGPITSQHVKKMDPYGRGLEEKELRLEDSEEVVALEY